MSFHAKLFCAVAVSALAATSSAHALTPQQCSAKYQAAKTAGTLGEQKWNDFRKAQCGADATAAPAATSAVASAAPKEATASPKKEAAAATAAPAAPQAPAVFPAVVDPKFAKETASKARMQTCAAQWKVNKAANTTGGLRWIQKGGGFWSECNKKLKA